VTDLTPEEREAKIAKLPAWARAEFDRLNMRLEEARAVADELTDAEADGWVGVYGDYPKPAVPTGEYVRFPIDLGGHDYVEIRRYGEGVEVRGSRGVLIHPTSSNAFSVELEDNF
jgi:hypothetical protein